MSLQEDVARIEPAAVNATLRFFARLGLLTGAEIDEVQAMLAADFPFADAIRSAESVHVHVKVHDTAALPHAEIQAAGTHPESTTEGFVKYPFDTGVNLIFSSIPISEDDMLTGEPELPPAVMDHKGVDLRQETPEVRAVFDGVPGLAAERGWRHKGQGGGGTPVYCCHTEVDEKHWVYPNEGDAGQRRPIEFAFGELKIHDSKMGCDLRPIDPAHPRAAEASAALSACAAGHQVDDDGAVSPSYYERKDLGHFADVGQFAEPMMKKFWDYYLGVFGGDSALTKREKALIGLAVAHSKQCPYCIDSFTGTCVDLGVSADQMHEAVHCAAALAAGIDLVHGVQMQNVLKLKGAI